MDITRTAARRLGTRATAYVEEHALPPCWRGRLVPETERTPESVARTLTRVYGRPFTVPYTERTPESVARTLTRVYGRPWTVDRGEVAYWEIPSEDVEVEA
jgi:hypothetical protein